MTDEEKMDMLKNEIEFNSKQRKSIYVEISKFNKELRIANKERQSINQKLKRLVKKMKGYTSNCRCGGYYKEAFNIETFDASGYDHYNFCPQRYEQEQLKQKEAGNDTIFP